LSRLRRLHIPGAAMALVTVFRVANAALQFVVALEYLGAFSIVGSLLALVLGRPTVAAGLLGFAAGIGLVLVCLLLTYYLRPLNVIAADFDIVTAEYTFAFDPDCPERATQSTLLEIEATRDGAHLFENRFSWTGSGQAYLPRIQGGSARVLGHPVRRWGWSNYYIELGEELKAHERRILTVVQDLDDPGLKMVPYLTKTVTKPLHDLILAVRFSETRAPDIVRRVHASGPPPSGTVFDQPEPLEVGRDFAARWRIRQPHFGHWYALEWDWPEGD